MSGRQKSTCISLFLVILWVLAFSNPAWAQEPASTEPAPPAAPWSRDMPLPREQAAEGLSSSAEPYRYFLFSFGAQAPVGQFNRPAEVAIAPDGSVYVADRDNSRIQHFGATGTFLETWGSYGSGDGQFSRPSGVAVAPDGTVYVADTYNHRIQRFSADGAFLGSWGSEGSGDGQFWNPGGVAVAPDGTVYVADTGNDRIQAFGTAYPTTWRGEYFGNRWLAEAPVLIRQEAQISFDWGAGSPGAGVPADEFSARWYRYAWFPAGMYRFRLFVDDGARLWVDDQLLIEERRDPQAAWYEAVVTLEQGYHFLRLDYYEAYGAAGVWLSWEPAIKRVVLPMVGRAYSRLCDPYEPNDDRRLNPWGPMQAGVVYRAKLCRGDEEDNYFFDVGGTDLEHGSRLDVVRVRFASP